MTPALFVVLDTALIKTMSGRKYSIHSEDWKFINQTVEAIRDYSKKGYKICILSDMPDVRDDFTSEKSFNRKLNLVLTTLEKDLAIRKNTILSATYSGVSELYTLPNPGLLYGLALDHDLDLYRSVLVGGNLINRSIVQRSGIGLYKDVTDLYYPI